MMGYTSKNETHALYRSNTMTNKKCSLFKIVLFFMITSLLMFSFSTASAALIIVDHTSTDITQIPQSAIEQAKTDLHIAYGHTSHGSQLITGMNGLVDFANGHGLGLSLPMDIFEWSNGGGGGALDLHDYFVSGDLGNPDRTTWAQRTRTYLNDPANSDVNVVIWSWCGQVDTSAANIDLYLSLMNQLEIDYPGVTFVYMTGHANGGGEGGNVHIRNQQIRDYCIANNKTLYNFYDIECYDPDNNYFGDKQVNDNCDYDSDGNGSLDANWAIEWQNTHTEDVDWYDCSPAHTQALNGNQKAYAAWWLWARIAGWNPGATEYTLTVNVQGTGTVSLNPSGGIYDVGTSVELTASAGAGWVFSHWSGALSGSQNPATIIMNGDRTVTATFTEVLPLQYTLTIGTSGNGIVTLDPTGGSYDAGTDVELTAQADPGWEFSAWGGGGLSGSQNPETIKMDSDKNVIATFTEIIPIQYTLTVFTQGSGSVTPNGGIYDEGTSVTLTPQPDPGWEFSAWSGDLSGTQDPETIIMDNDKNVTATFIESVPDQAGDNQDKDENPDEWLGGCFIRSCTLRMNR